MSCWYFSNFFQILLLTGNIFSPVYFLENFKQEIDCWIVIWVFQITDDYARKKIQRINDALDTDPVQIEQLRKLMTSPKGCVTNDVRCRVWPKLLNVNIFEKQAKLIGKCALFKGLSLTSGSDIKRI